mmetsp:Transcript_6243/g.9712  ORF Transcript_6243/g.9712 Transcript_6243/m.9712 type:complete len:211 (+) Transcript_6243:1197-1829(+)
MHHRLQQVAVLFSVLWQPSKDHTSKCVEFRLVRTHCLASTDDRFSAKRLRFSSQLFLVSFPVNGPGAMKQSFAVLFEQLFNIGRQALCHLRTWFELDDKICGHLESNSFSRNIQGAVQDLLHLAHQSGEGVLAAVDVWFFRKVFSKATQIAPLKQELNGSTVFSFRNFALEQLPASVGVDDKFGELLEESHDAIQTDNEVCALVFLLFLA